MSKNYDDDGQKPKSAYLFIGAGIICVCVSVIVHVAHLIETKNQVLIVLNDFFVQLLSHLGIGFFAIGLLSILLEMSHWTHYFETRLSKIVIEKKYLEKLSTSALITVQTEVLRAFFKNDQIGGKEGFLNYYQKNLQHIIDMPYRNNVSLTLSITPDDGACTKLKVFEVLNYRCMANGKKFQETIPYTPDKGEHYKIFDFKVTLQHDDFKSLPGAVDGHIVYDLAKLKSVGACKNIEDGFELDIKEHTKDCLNVTIQANYLIVKNRFIAWRMSQPSNNVTLHLTYPTNLEVAKELFVNERNASLVSQDQQSGYFNLNIAEWLLPGEGVTFQFVDRLVGSDEESNATSN